MIQALANNRKPGPIGIGGIDPIDDGTLCRRVSHPPGPTGIQHSHGAVHQTSNRHFHPHTEIPSAKRAPSAGSLLVEYGDRGPAVQALQKLLNVHLDPAPNLKIDGNFGPKTLAALKRYQTAQKLKADGVAGKATWYRLTYTDPRKAGRIVQPQVAADVSTWPMSRRFAEVIRLLPGKLPHEIWNQLMGLMSTDLMVIAVGLYAASHLFGVGELIDIGIGLLVAEQGVIELADCVQITVLAMSPKDLEEAAAHLARAISIVGVFKFVTLLARFLKNRPEASNKPPTDSTSQTPAPVSGKTTSTAPPQSGETSGTLPPRPGLQSSSIEESKASSEPQRPQARHTTEAGSTSPKKLESGPGYLEEPTPETARAYERIATSNNDIARIAENTRISESYISRVKAHLFAEEHTMSLPDETGSIVTRTGRFTPDEAVADLWTKATDGALSPEEQVQFRRLIAHEYVEQGLMADGMPYRSPDAWNEGVNLPTSENYGAHDLAPLTDTMRDPFSHWRALGKAPEGLPPLSDDLSNLDDVLNAVRQQESSTR